MNGGKPKRNGRRTFGEFCKDGKQQETVARVLREAGVVTSEALMGALNHDDSRIRASAAMALGCRGETRAVPRLGEKLKDREWWVRYWAAVALGEIGDLRAVSPLLGALWDEDEWVRKATCRALKKLRASERFFSLMIEGLKAPSPEKRSLSAENMGEFGDPRAKEFLTPALEDENLMVRRYAVRSLGKLGDFKALPLLKRYELSFLTGNFDWAAERIFKLNPTPRLIEHIRNPRAFFLEACVKELGRRVDARDAVRPLAELLKEPRPESVRRAIYRTIGKIGGAEAEAALIHALSGEEDRQCRQIILGFLGASRTYRSKQFLMETSKRVDEDEETRVLAVKMLGMRGGRDVDKLLQSMAEGSDDRNISRAARMAGKKVFLMKFVDVLCEETPELQPELKAATQSALKTIEEDTWYWFRFFSDWIVVLIGKKSETFQLLRKTLYRQLGHQSPEIRGTAAAFLGNVGDYRARGVLLKMLKDEEHPLVRRAIVEALGVLRCPEAVLSLLRELSNGNTLSRFTAACALGDIGSSQAIESLAEILRKVQKRENRTSLVPEGQSPDALETFGLSSWYWEPLAFAEPNVYHAAIWALGKTGHPRALGPLLDVLHHEERGSLREAALQALGNIKSPKSLHILIQTLKDPFSDLRMSAIWGLKKMKEPFCVPPLLDILKRERNRVVQEGIIGILKDTKSADSVPGLVEFMRHTPEKFLEDAAKEALGEIGGTAAVNALAEIVLRNPDCPDAEAMEALGKTRDPKFIEVFLRVFPHVRSQDIFALTSLRDAKVWNAVRMVLSSGYLEHRYQVVKNLITRDDPETAEVFIQALSDPHEDVRRCAVLRLKVKPEPLAHGALVRALKDDAWEIRRMAAEALAKMDDPLGTLVAGIFDERHAEEEEKYKELMERNDSLL